MTTLYHQIWIDAPVSRVYQALSSAEAVSSWWDEQTERETADGVVWEHSPQPVGAHGVVAMKVLERMPHRRVLWECVSKHVETVPASEWTGTRCLFELCDRKDCASANARWATGIPAQTVLDFRHAGWSETADYLGFCNSAWAMVLQELKRVCEEGS